MRLAMPARNAWYSSTGSARAAGQTIVMIHAWTAAKSQNNTPSLVSDSRTSVFALGTSFHGGAPVAHHAFHGSSGGMIVKRAGVVFMTRIWNKCPGRVPYGRSWHRSAYNANKRRHCICRKHRLRNRCKTYRRNHHIVRRNTRTARLNIDRISNSRLRSVLLQKSFRCTSCTS